MENSRKWTSNYKRDGNEKTKYNLITVENVGHSHTRPVISEKVQPESNGIQTH